MKKREEPDTMTAIQTRLKDKRWLIPMTLAILAMSFTGATANAQQSALAPPSSRAFASATSAASHDRATPAAPAATNDAAAQAAFLRSWTVFNSPRCRNCHPAGDAPLQGDDSHVHIQDVKRGPDGHGVYSMKCN
ncbi:MAG: hypothetical protein WA772_01780, partial [Candidatus Acidiferrales bacterium]